jgi:hypothetical protein
MGVKVLTPKIPGKHLMYRSNAASHRCAVVPGRRLRRQSDSGVCARSRHVRTRTRACSPSCLPLSRWCLPDTYDANLMKCVANFDKPTCIQAQCWPICLRGRDLVGIAATGSGKTLGFGLPGLTHIMRQVRPGLQPALSAVRRREHAAVEVTLGAINAPSFAVQRASLRGSRQCACTGAFRRTSSASSAPRARTCSSRRPGGCSTSATRRR